MDRTGKTKKVEKEQNWRKWGVEGEHKHGDKARKEKTEAQESNIRRRQEGDDEQEHKDRKRKTEKQRY